MPERIIYPNGGAKESWKNIKGKVGWEETKQEGKFEGGETPSTEQGVKRSEGTQEALLATGYKYVAGEKGTKLELHAYCVSAVAAEYSVYINISGKIASVAAPTVLGWVTCSYTHELTQEELNTYLRMEANTTPEGKAANAGDIIYAWYYKLYTEIVEEPAQNIVMIV